MSPDSDGRLSPLLSRADWVSLRRWFRRHGRHAFPWRHKPTSWRILVAETLLRRTRADIAARLYPSLLNEFPDPAAVVQRPQRWRDLTAPLGLAWRADTFVRACKALIEKHAGRIPTSEDALLALPGVGHYVARGVRCFGFGKASVLVDTNTIRLSSRLSGSKVDPTRHRSRDIQQLVARLGPSGRALGANDNFALLDLAALVCLPHDPKCHACPVATSCATGHSRVDLDTPAMAAEPRTKRYMT